MPLLPDIYEALRRVGDGLQNAPSQACHLLAPPSTDAFALGRDLASSSPQGSIPPPPTQRRNPTICLRLRRRHSRTPSPARPPARKPRAPRPRRVAAHAEPLKIIRARESLTASGSSSSIPSLIPAAAAGAARPGPGRTRVRLRKSHDEKEGADLDGRTRPEQRVTLKLQVREAGPPSVAAARRCRQPAVMPPAIGQRAVAISRHCQHTQALLLRHFDGQRTRFQCGGGGGGGGTHIVPLEYGGGVPAALAQVEVASGALRAVPAR
jgi:hypothetical protein